MLVAVARSIIAALDWNGQCNFVVQFVDHILEVEELENDQKIFYVYFKEIYMHLL